MWGALFRVLCIVHAELAESKHVGDAIMAQQSVLPAPYRLFFTIVEPGLTVGGVVYAVLSPHDYLQQLVPASPTNSKLENILVRDDQNAVMAVRQLGSSSIHFRSICTLFDPTLTTEQQTKPTRQSEQTKRQHQQKFETVVHGYLLCLALADLTHIGFTLYDLGIHFATRPSTWTTLVWGNVGITTILFIVRSLWFAQVARASYTDNKDRSE
ncbi:hypothetical protein OIV83_002289 [Microbotryomycetes sp. JL201]|nr:hypothetical protein OIV83_002289 [Microbotryomycetes sp. JL201]